jgi:T5SS/PEP-CTERM-associated repeat protein
MMKTNLQHKQHKIFFGRNAILLTITALALLASPGVALADCTPVTNWTDGKSSWFTCSNWSNNECPDSGIGAVVDNGGTAQISVSTPQASACSLSLGPTSGHSGNVSVSTSGSLTVTHGITVGDQGTGSLTVTNSGSSVTSGDGIDVGGSTGTTPGVGTLTVSDSATVSAASVTANTSGTLTGNGTVIVNSGSGTVTINSGTLAPHPGTLTITGNLLFSNINSNMSCNVSSTSVDKVQVSGGATLNGKLSVTVNSAGDFTLLHAAGGLGGTKFSSYSFTYNGCFSASVSYDNGTDVVLHVVTTCN